MAEVVVFIPSPLMGHVGQAVKLAKTMIDRFHHLSASVLLMKLPTDVVGNNYTDSLSSISSSDRIRFLHLPPPNATSYQSYATPGDLADLIIEEHKPAVTDFVRRLATSQTGKPPPPRRVAALVVDMFCTSMIEVGKEFGIPTYVFFPSNAAFLGLMLHLQALQDEHGVDIPDLKNSVTELLVPSYACPVPPTLLPFVLRDRRTWSARFSRYGRGYREARGIIINTFAEIEPHALHSYDAQTPPVYTVGPMLKPVQPTPRNDGVMMWLDGQPDSSVIFLCFGSRGCFNAEQVREIATALERSGFRFLWSLREPPQTGAKGFPNDCGNPAEVLPKEFLERTAGAGKVLGWAPQMAVLSHKAVGGFVSHCGWNSILESIWCGVPIATWPLYAEQQLDALQLVRELGLGVEISLDYDQLHEKKAVVKAEKIEIGIRRVMKENSKVRKNVKEMSEKSRIALKEGGSSYTSLERLIHDMMIHV